MVNKCCAVGCKTGYDSGNDGKVSSFTFPFDKKDLLERWIKFINRTEWAPSKYSVICIKHFEEKFIIRGNRNKLNWKLDPYPTLHSTEILKRPSLIPISSVPPRKAPKLRVLQQDQMQEFYDKDTIKDLANITLKNCPSGFECKISSDYIVFYKLEFDAKTKFPIILESIKIDNNLHVKLEYKGSPVPLPHWFIKGKNANLTRYSMLENLVPYLNKFKEDVLSENSFQVLEELRNQQHYKPKGRPPYSADMIRFALLLRYTSPQAYRLLLEKFPLPSMSLLKKLHHGGVDSMKALKTLKEKGEYICT